MKARVASARRWLRWATSRWPFAEAMNHLRRTCWCDLVSWALDGDIQRSRRSQNLLRYDEGLLRGDGTVRCRADATEGGACYCGKFRTAEFEQQHGLRSGFVVPQDGAA